MIESEQTVTVLTPIPLIEVNTIKNNIRKGINRCDTAIQHSQIVQTHANTHTLILSDTGPYAHICRLNEISTNRSILGTTPSPFTLTKRKEKLKTIGKRHDKKGPSPPFLLSIIHNALPVCGYFCRIRSSNPQLVGSNPLVMMITET